MDPSQDSQASWLLPVAGLWAILERTFGGKDKTVCRSEGIVATLAIAAVLGACLFLVLCGCATVRGRPKVAIEHSSPQALAASYHRALESKDFAGMLECIAPKWQAEYDDVLVEAKRAWKEISPTKTLIEKKIGKKQAEQFLRKAQENVLPSPFADVVVDGQPDWGRVAWTIKEDRGSASVGDVVLFKTKRIQDKWYMVPDSSDEDFRSMLQMAKGLFHGAVMAAGSFRFQIRMGLINRDNFDERVLGVDKEEAQYSARRRATPYGPSLDGVRIRMTTWKPFFHKGKRIQFSIEFKYQTKEPVCWWMPSTWEGLGKNVTLFIDERPFQWKPDSEVEIVVPEIAGVWSIVVPEDIVRPLRPGKHTMRYELVSNGGTYTDAQGRKYRVLKGKLTSNTLTFEIRE